MKKFHQTRLLKLADFLDKLPREKFNINFTVHEEDEKGCGAVCCAIGWTPKIFPKLVSWYQIIWDKSAADVAVSLFDISYDEALYLFYPHNEDITPGNIENRLLKTATPKQVAKRIRKFVTKKQKL